MECLPTRYGPVPSQGPAQRYPDGTVRAVSVDGPVAFETALGRLVPQHTIDDGRRLHKPPVTFFPGGQVRSLPLETRTEVATPAGPVPAELVTFHENGAVARVFPLNGKLSGYWTEADEGRLAETLRLRTPLGPVAARFVTVAFDPEGRLRSLTLWPDATVTVPTPAGNAPVRLGLSFHPGGGLRSVEPARPLEVPTPVGPVWAYDPDAVGISGDGNSLVFDEHGRVRRVATVQTAVAGRGPDGGRLLAEPLVRESICGGGDHELTPLVLAFADGAVTVSHGCGRPEAVWSLGETALAVRPFLAAFAVSFAPKQCSM